MSGAMLLRDRRFRPLFWTQFLGALNDNLLKNAMVVLVEYKGLSLLGLDPPSIVALAGAVFILPFFLFSMLAGQLADRFEKSRLVRLVKIWELLITLVASVGYYTHNLYLLMAALFMMGMHSTFFGPIKYSSLPDLVSDAKLVAANAYVEVGTFLAILLGTIGGGVLIALEAGEIWISAAVNVCALAGIFSSRFVPHLPPHSPGLKIRLSPIAPLRETIQMLKDKPSVFQALIGISWFWFFGAALLSILPPFCKEFLKADEHVVTAFLAMFTLGIGMGSLFCERLSKERVVLGLVLVGAVGMSLCLLDLSFIGSSFESGREARLLTLLEFLSAPHGPRLLVDFLLMSVFGGFFALPLYTAMQARSEKSVRSRVVAGNNVMNAILMVGASLFVMTFHLQGVPPTSTFVVLAGLNLMATAYMCWRVPEFITSLREWWSEGFGK